MKTAIKLLIISITYCQTAFAQHCPNLNVVGSFRSYPGVPFSPASDGYTYANDNGLCYEFTHPYPDTICFEFMAPDYSAASQASIFVRGCSNINQTQSAPAGSSGCNSGGSSGGNVAGWITYNNACAVSAPSFQTGGCHPEGSIITLCVRINPTNCGTLRICPVYACGSVGCASPLPVILESFNVENNVVEWRTATELNFSHFVVEYLDNNNVFTPASGNIMAEGVDPNGATYSYTHNYRQENPEIYYRLRMTDFDGEVTYSPIIVSNSSQNEMYYSNNYIYLNKFNKTKSDQEILIYDLSGKLFFSKKVNNNEVIPWDHKGVFILHVPELNKQFKITAF